VAKLFADNTIQRFSVIRLLQYVVSPVGENTAIIISSVEVLQNNGSMIGNPDLKTLGYGASNQSKSEVKHQELPSQSASSQNTPSSPVKTGTSRVISSPTRQNPVVYKEVASTGDTITPIKLIHPYQNMWTIRARVTSKTPMKEFARKTGGGVGKLFSVDLIDAAGDEIRATAFTEVAEKLYGLLEVGHVYLISKGEVKVANKKFTTIPHSFEITFTNATVVSPVVEDSSTASIPVGHFSFVPIEKIASMDANELVDVLGVVTQTTDAQTFTQKSTGRDLTKKTLTLMDNTAYSIEVTLWGDLAKNTNPDVGNVVAIRAARVGTFNGKSLSTGGASQVTVSPDIAEAKKLSTWYQEKGSSSTVVPISDGTNRGEGGAAHEDVVKTLATVQSEQVGMGQQSEYFTCLACIVNIKHDSKISYTSCTKCNSKVIPNEDGQFYCAKCGPMPDATEAYSLRMQIADTTGSIWVTCFRDAALTIMNNREASELVALQTSGNEGEFNMAFDDAAHKWYRFRVRAKMDTYHEEVRVQYSVVSLTPIDFAKESMNLLSVINAYPTA